MTRTTRPSSVVAARRSIASANAAGSLIRSSALLLGSARSSSRATDRRASSPGSTTGRTVFRGRRLSSGTTPARISDDFPLPEGPTTRTGAGFGRSRRSMTSSMSSSRPNRTAAYFSVSRSRPGYGETLGSQLALSRGPSPTRPRSATSLSTSSSTSRIGPIDWVAARTGWTGSFRVLIWTTCLRRAIATASSVWHQRDSSDAGVARKTTIRKRSRLRNSSSAHLVPAGIPSSRSLSRKTSYPRSSSSSWMRVASLTSFDE